jgi:hypothetical protein
MPGIDRYTVLDMHFDGTNGSTTFPDSSSYAHGNATVTATVTVDTSQSKFGGASGVFNGTSGFLTFPNSSDWEFGSGDFTIDWWERRTTTAGGQATACRENIGYPGWLVGWLGGSPGHTQFYASSTGVGWDIAVAKDFGAVEYNVWHHFAVTRSGTTFRTFRDGVQQDIWSDAGTLFPGTNPLSIGKYLTGDLVNSVFFPGNIDEFRLSKGVARWTANFIPPTAPYDSALGFDNEDNSKDIAARSVFLPTDISGY